MPFWLLIVIIAHLSLAGAFLVDKFLLVRAIPKPTVYTFYIAVLGIIALVFLPFGYVQPTLAEFGLAALAGITFDLSLLFFFSALRWLETSRVVPFVGGVQPLLILLFAFFFLGERLGMLEIVAFFTLVFGTALVSIDMHDTTPAEAVQRRKGWAYAVLATIFFAITFTMTKAVFETQSFLSGFVWIRVGAFLFAMLFLSYRPWRQAILSKQERPQGKYQALFFSGQAAGAIGALLLNYAISLTSVTIVTAMQGLQYAFLFLLAIILGKKYAALRERLNMVIIIRKSFAILLIGVGLVLLAT